MSWLILSFAIPILVAWNAGTTYGFAFSLIGIGVVMYVANTLLIRFFISEGAPQVLEDGNWEQTSGTGLVPKWVSVMGLIGMGLAPSGIVVALLLAAGIVSNQAG